MNAVQHILMLGVRLYRWVISPAKTLLFGPLGRCRFTPSCSEYALDAIRTHGALGGSWLAVRRICRCHPWGGCGHDPVPEGKSKVQSLNSSQRYLKFSTDETLFKCNRVRDVFHSFRAVESKVADPINSKRFGFRASDFLRISDFGFRISPQRGRADLQRR